MTRLQLATILSWGDNNCIQGRKRLQKVVFFLQEAGCPLDCQYTLHHFGPYSSDVADACDEMVAAGLVEETGGPQNGVKQYSYRLKPETSQLLGQTPNDPMKIFQELGAQLIRKDIWPLELGSTILLFYKQTQDWELALTRACEFKKVKTESPDIQEAIDLAKRIHGHTAI